MRLTKIALSVLEAARTETHATRFAPGAPSRRAEAELAEFITTSARRVHQRYGRLKRQQAEDFVDESAGYITQVLMQHFPRFYAALPKIQPGSDPAAAWILTCLANRYHTICRRRIAVQLVCDNRNEAGGEVHNPLDLLPGDGRRTACPSCTLDDREFASAPFGAADLNRVEAWRPLDAVVLMLLSGLYPKLPQDLWRQRLEACGVRGPFPTVELLDLPETRRRDEIARVLGIARNHLDKIWSVKRRWLAGLDLVSQLRDRPKEAGGAGRSAA